MKAVFAHDFPMLVTNDNTNIYSAGGFPYSVWERYLKHFETLTVLGRERNLNALKLDISKLSKSNGPNVSFKVLPNLKSFKGMTIDQIKATRIIEAELEKADFLIARLPSSIGALSVKVAKKLKKPYLIEMVGCPYDSAIFHGSIKGKFYAPLNKLKNQKLLKNSRYTIYVTKNYLQKKYPTKGKEINISNVNIKKCEPEVLKKRIQKINKKNNFSPLMIGIIGSLNAKYKGIDIAIKYFSLLKEELPPFELHILGNGDPKNFEELISKTDMSKFVYFDGVRSNGDEVNEWLDNLDLYIQPSLTEGLPRALVEALSRGCPAIGSNVGGIPELLNEDFLFNPNNFEEFVEVLQKILKKENQISQAQTNYNTAKNYEINVLSERRESFFESAIQGSGIS